MAVDGRDIETIRQEAEKMARIKVSQLSEYFEVITEGVVMIGEIGGTKEQDAADYIKNHFKKPVAALIVGKSAPANRRMGHAGAIITGKSGSASEKISALRSAGCAIINSPAQIGDTVNELSSTWIKTKVWIKK